MTFAELFALFAEIEELSLYSVRAKSGAVLPYLVGVYGSSDNFEADNKTYSRSMNYILELYTTNKDLTLESKVEKVLIDNEIPFETDEAFDDGQQFYLKYYYIRG